MSSTVMVEVHLPTSSRDAKPQSTTQRLLELAGHGVDGHLASTAQHRGLISALRKSGAKALDYTTCFSSEYECEVVDLAVRQGDSSAVGPIVLQLLDSAQSSLSVPPAYNRLRLLLQSSATSFLRQLGFEFEHDQPPLIFLVDEPESGGLVIVMLRDGQSYQGPEAAAAHALETGEWWQRVPKEAARHGNKADAQPARGAGETGSVSPLRLPYFPNPTARVKKKKEQHDTCLLLEPCCLGRHTCTCLGECV